MKTRGKILFTILLSVSFMGVFLSSGAFADKQPTLRVAVMGFEKKGKKMPVPDLDQIIHEWLITFLVNTNRFEVIERQSLEKVLHEQSLGQSGVIDSESAAKVGEILGVNILVTGTLMAIGGEDDGHDDGRQKYLLFGKSPVLRHSLVSRSVFAAQQFAHQIISGICSFCRTRREGAREYSASSIASAGNREKTSIAHNTFGTGYLEFCQTDSGCCPAVSRHDNIVS